MSIKAKVKSLVVDDDNLKIKIVRVQARRVEGVDSGDYTAHVYRDGQTFPVDIIRRTFTPKIKGNLFKQAYDHFKAAVKDPLPENASLADRKQRAAEDAVDGAIYGVSNMEDI